MGYDVGPLSLFDGIVRGPEPVIVKRLEVEGWIRVSALDDRTTWPSIAQHDFRIKPQAPVCGSPGRMGVGRKGRSTIGAVPAETRSKKAPVSRFLVLPELYEIVKVRVQRSRPVILLNGPYDEGEVVLLDPRAVGEIVPNSGVRPDDFAEGLQQFPVRIDPGATNEADLEGPPMGDLVVLSDLEKRACELLSS